MSGVFTAQIGQCSVVTPDLVVETLNKRSCKKRKKKKLGDVQMSVKLAEKLPVIVCFCEKRLLQL